MNIRDLKFMLAQFAASGIPDTTEIVIVDAEGYGASPVADTIAPALYWGNMNNRGRIYATPQQRKAAGLPAELDVDAPEGSDLVLFLYPAAGKVSTASAREKIIGLIAGDSTGSLRTIAEKTADEILAGHARELAATETQDADPNVGPGWYEVINPRDATTCIALVYDGGSLYLPEGEHVLNGDEFAFAAARGRVHRLVRADEQPPHVRAARYSAAGDEMAASLVRDGFGDDEITDILRDPSATTED